MTHELELFQNIPITPATIASCYPKIRNPKKKLQALERAGDIINLKKGLYVVAPEINGKNLSTELIANHLYGPSFVSQTTALRYYGLIPERVYLTQSMAMKRSRQFETPIGKFQYTQISHDSFSVGVRCIQANGYSFLIASPERALCDVIAHCPNLQLRYLSETAAYLEENLRLDMDAFQQMDRQVFRDYIAVGKKSSSIQTILKLLES